MYQSIQVQLHHHIYHKVPLGYEPTMNTVLCDLTKLLCKYLDTTELWLNPICSRQ